MGHSHALSREDALWIKKVIKKVNNKRVLHYGFKNPSTMKCTPHSHLTRALADMEKYKGWGWSPPPGPFALPGFTLAADSEDNPVAAIGAAVPLPTAVESSPSPETGSASTSPSLRVSGSEVR